MNAYWAPIGISLFCWWFGTGAVFLIERLLRRYRSAAPMVIVLLAGGALVGVAWATQLSGGPAAYAGFACAIGLWGALELSFLTGWLTGPRRHACPPGCAGLGHFWHAVHALIHHELALMSGAVAVLLIGGGPDRVAVTTFLLLWLMRESAKLNLFIGVRNPAAELLPQPLAHLACYFGRPRLNPLLPLSVLGTGIACVQFARAAALALDGSEAQLGDTLIATLLALGAVEHLMLALPVRPDALWTWATRRRVSAPSLSCCERHGHSPGPSVTH